MQKGIPGFTTETSQQNHKIMIYRLSAHGGGDWEELAMRGIQLAIENSRPGSIIYVITDAPAKDYTYQVSVDRKPTNIIQNLNFDFVFRIP